MYGQYSYNGAGRLTKSEIVPSIANKAKKVGHNRVVWSYGPNKTMYRLIGTDVVTRFADGTFMITDGGFATMTTRRAMMQGLKELGCEMNPGIYGCKKAGTDHVYIWRENGERRETPFKTTLWLNADGKPTKVE